MSKHEQGRISDKGDSLINPAATNRKSTLKKKSTLTLKKNTLRKNQRSLNESRKGIWFFLIEEEDVFHHLYCKVHSAEVVGFLKIKPQL